MLSTENSSRPSNILKYFASHLFMYNNAGVIFDHWIRRSIQVFLVQIQEWMMNRWNPSLSRKPLPCFPHFTRPPCQGVAETSEILVSREFSRILFHFHFSFSISSRFNFTFTSRKRVKGFYFSLFTSRKKWKLSIFHSFFSRKKSEIRCGV